MWFSILECGFKASMITNSLTKFTHAVSLLPPDVLPLVSHTISTASSSDTPYEDLKPTLRYSLQTSMATRLRELLSKEELGDEKPSQLLSRMRQLLGNKYPAFDFIATLPQSRGFLVASVSTCDADQLAQLSVEVTSLKKQLQDRQRSRSISRHRRHRSHSRLTH